MAKKAIKINKIYYVRWGENVSMQKLINYLSESSETFQIGSGWLRATSDVKDLISCEHRSFILTALVDAN